jgi:hypothetical protein
MHKRVRLPLLCLFAATPIFSQTTSTSILGAVTDASGGAVAGARVTIVHTRTGQKRQDKTASNGYYNFPLLDIGSYNVTVEKEGFQSQTRTNIPLQLNQKARVDVVLEVGIRAERVEIAAEASSLLRTDESALGQVVDQRRLAELPLDGRNLAGLAVLQPGIQFGQRMGFDGQSGAGGGIPVPGVAISLSANGQRDANQHATLDGVVITEARVNTVPFAPSVEAVEEFRVQSGSYSAEFGTNSGAQLSIVLRSGTNDFHGAAFEFIRNDALDAENYFQNYFNAPGAPRLKKDGLRRNQFGGVLTGHLTIPGLYRGKDKTFFMVNYEAQLKRQPGGAAPANHPTLPFRDGNLGALLNRRDSAGRALPSIVVVDPVGGRPFPGNVIPASRISPTARALTSYWPAPTSASGDPLSGVNFIGFSNTRLDDDQRLVRIDHNFSSRNKIFGHYAFDDVSYRTDPGDNPNFGTTVSGRNQNVATQWLHLFTPTTINELRYGYSRSVSNTLSPRSNTNFDLDSVGLSGLRLISDGNRKFTPREAGLPNIRVTHFSPLGERDGGNGFDFNNQHQISDNATMSRGGHNLKAGIDFRRVALYRAASDAPRGSLNFTDAVANNAFAAFLLGYPGTTETPEGLPEGDARQHRWAGYFLDDWKPARRVTVILGVRYEYNSAATDIRGRWRSLSFKDAINGVPALLPRLGVQHAFYKPEKKLFMPRIGLAWRMSDKWVARAGYGIYYNVHQLANYTLLNLNPPLSGASQFSQAAEAGVLLAGRSPLTFAAPFGAAAGDAPTNANALNPDNFQPRINQWSIDFQRQLPSRSVITLGYVGSKGVHLDNSVELNNPDPGLSSLPTTPQQRRPYQYLVDGSGGPVRTLTRLRWLDSGANSWYHGLQLNAEKRTTHGFHFNAAYTWSKALGEGYGRNETAGFVNSGSYQNPRSRAADKGRYGFDVRHNLILSSGYEIPTAWFANARATRLLLGGWQMNGIWTIRSGFPFSVTQDNTLNTYNSPVRPDRLRSGALDSRSLDRWFDTEAFRLVTCEVDYLSDRCHYGSSGNGILDGPAFRNLDFSFFKHVTVKDNARVQFRAEFFNLFNSPNFAPPNAQLTGTTAFLPRRDPLTSQIGPDPAQGGRVAGPGAITSLIAPMRVVQFGLKFLF